MNLRTLVVLAVVIVLLLVAVGVYVARLPDRDLSTYYLPAGRTRAEINAEGENAGKEVAQEAANATASFSIEEAAKYRDRWVDLVRHNRLDEANKMVLPQVLHYFVGGIGPSEVIKTDLEAGKCTFQLIESDLRADNPAYGMPYYKWMLYQGTRCTYLRIFVMRGTTQLWIYAEAA